MPGRMFTQAASRGSTSSPPDRLGGLRRGKGRVDQNGLVVFLHLSEPPTPSSAPATPCQSQDEIRQDCLRRERDARGREALAAPRRSAMATCRPGEADAIVALGGDGLHAADAASLHERRHADLRHEPRLGRLPHERLQRGGPARAPRRRRRQPHPSAVDDRLRPRGQGAQGARHQRGVAVPRALSGGQAAHPRR